MKIMDSIGYTELIFAALCFLFLRHYLNSKTLPTNWPFIGMLPSLFLNIHRVLDWCTYYLSINGCTFVFTGPWFTNMTDILCTSDPANMRYIFNTNFPNYPKGPEFKEFFDILGDGIFNSDSDSWKAQRKVAHLLVHHKTFVTFLEQTTLNKVENGLIPVLEHVVERNLVVDLQDLVKRFMFDNSVVLLSGIDPGCLAIEFKKYPYVDAFDDIEEAIFYRHAMPVNWWKLQRLVGVGKEKKLSKARDSIEQFLALCISTKRAKMQNKKERSNDLLASYMEEEVDSGPESDKFLRDTMLNFMLAGRSTVSAALTWFFWLVSENPTVEDKIVEELKTKAISRENISGKNIKTFTMEELRGLVYLHGVFCEALRLYPPVPFEHKRPVQPDILPSGHRVDTKTKILPLLYAMGRMEEVWGKDCLEVKPERWISKTGGMEYVPSFKFMAFNSGPRTCVGKEIAFTQMKMVAATLLYNYHVEVVEGHSITPKNSIILYMKYGMQARIRRRS